MGEREIDEYLSAAQELGYLLIFLLALEYGLQQRELIALKWSDVDPKRSTLSIYEDRVVSYRQLVEYGEMRRTIVLPQFVTEQLVKEHLKHPHSEVLFIHPGTLKPYSPAVIRLCIGQSQDGPYPLRGPAPHLCSPGNSKQQQSSPACQADRKKWRKLSAVWISSLATWFTSDKARSSPG